MKICCNGWCEMYEFIVIIVIIVIIIILIVLALVAGQGVAYSSQ